MLGLHQISYPASAEIHLSLYPTISGPGRIWLPDMRPHVCKCSEHNSARFSADTVQ